MAKLDYLIYYEIRVFKKNGSCYNIYSLGEKEGLVVSGILFESISVYKVQVYSIAQSKIIIELT
jgi:hypothetical protein